ncbi:cytidylate kinase [Flexibacter flexilis DSM 6793]|uniref:Cytidylate kinase n=1 Tax=Flexibacter flexilis DSM 6793 TaxID=927664 RepID=A0A1I1LR65_9BACT|nr:(d)CMP kinase [Flexibacter flexilis]SFC75456.1 cytidylate kinase [Flexibacter flexilis DSM 6793]
MRKIIIAIDGYSACGKSSTAKMVAARMGYAYIDTGAMYRAVTLYFKENHVQITNEKEVEKALNEIQITFRHNDKNNQNETYLNGLNVENEIRKMYISEQVSEVSALPQVRHAMVAQQQRMGKKRGIVMDGRDIGTMVFPDAELKIFMEADMQVRAVRRQQELLEKKQMVNLEDIVKNLEHRDHLDTTRKESPLVRAQDAYLLDSSYITLEEQVEIVVNMAVSEILVLEGRA